MIDSVEEQNQTNINYYTQFANHEPETSINNSEYRKITKQIFSFIFACTVNQIVFIFSDSDISLLNYGFNDFTFSSDTNNFQVKL